MDVWVLGRIAYDLFAAEIGKPLPECATFTRHVGGSSANIAVGLARLGLKVGMISCVGDDLFADYLTGFLNKEGVDTRFVQRAKGYGTQLCVGEVRPPFRQVFYRHKPADTQLAIGKEELNAVASASMFVTNGTSLSAEPSRTATLDALRAAKQARAPTVFDVDYRESSWPSAEAAGAVAREGLANIDIVIANEDEVTVLTGEKDPAKAVRKVLGAGPSLLVRKLGGAGVEAHTKDGSVKVAPLEVEVVSTVGAGDGFAAGFLHAWLSKKDLPDCLRRGNAAAAIVVSKVSCSDVMPRREEIDKLLASPGGERRPRQATLVGLDWSTSDANVGAALGRWRDGSLSVEEVTACDRRSPLAVVTDWLRKESDPVLFAVDAPLGWPVGLARALATHRAGDEPPVEADQMFRRATDRFVHRHVGKTPLDVGADRIARTAHAALRFLREVSDALGRPIPLAWAPQALLGISAIEVYPAATLSAHGVRSTGYKKPQNRAERREIVAALRIRIALPADEGCLEMSPDALDAVVCLLAAKDFVEERSMPPVDRPLAEQEGWIWVPAKTRIG